MRSLPLLLAWRYLFSNKENTIKSMVLVCLLGIIIGSCALALVAFVMQGFEAATYEKLQGIHSQIIMRAHDNALNIGAIKNVIKKEFPEVVALSGSSNKHLIISTASDDYNIASIRGINPKDEAQVSTLRSTIIKPKSNVSLETLLANNSVLIGETLAEKIDLKVGDTIELLIPSEPQGRRKTMRFNPAQAIVGGIFKTGIDEYDSNVLFCSLLYLFELFPETQITHVGIKLQPNVSNEDLIIKKLALRFGVDVYSWKNLYPALLSALTLEKYVMFLILALITLVASMSIVSLLFMLITQKRSDIALLKSMGVIDSHIRRIFIFIGMSISFIGSIIGLCSAVGAGYLLEHYHIIPLPDAYFVTHLPAQLNTSIILAVFLVVMVISFFATWWPSKRTSSINISHVLRYEG